MSHRHIDLETATIVERVSEILCVETRRDGKDVVVGFGSVGACEKNGPANVEDVCVEEGETLVLCGVGLGAVESGGIEGMIYVLYLGWCCGG